MVTRNILLTLIAIAIPVTVLAALTSSTVPSHNHSSAAQGGSAIAPASVTASGALSAGSISTTGTLSSTKACQTNHVRVGLSFCQWRFPEANGFISTYTSSTGCARTGVPPGAPTDAVAVRFLIKSAIYSNNLAGTRNFAVTFFGPSDTTCTGFVSYRHFDQIREQTAITVNTLLKESWAVVDLQTDSSGRTYAQSGTNNGGSVTNISLFYLGYLD